ncbi:hypothetical protein ACFLXD_04640 [Chloroflexota bacterium]
MKPDLRRTRLDMVYHLQDRMRSGYERYLDEQKLEWEGGLLKTYLVEADVVDKPRESHDQILKFLRAQAQTYNYSPEELDEENFFAILARAGSGKYDVFYIDASDSRFWIVYTVGHSTRTDKFMEKLVTNSVKLDNSWFPMQFLSRQAERGLFNGLGGRFNNDPFTKEEDEQLKISMKLWGNLAKDVFDAFQDSDRLRKVFSLSSIRLKRYFKGTDESITDDVNFYGKITSMGQSFDSHLDLVNKLYKDEYKHKITEVIEKELALGIDNESGVAYLKGEPIFIKFSNKISNIESFTRKLFSGTIPFRLWGLQQVIKNDFARVYAVDLHLGKTLTFEVFSDTIRIFLPLGTCGNTIARFFTLFQHHYDSSAEALGGKYDQLF